MADPELSGKIDTFEQAKQLLRGAVDTVLQAADKLHAYDGQSTSRSTAHADTVSRPTDSTGAQSLTTQNRAGISTALSYAGCTTSSSIGLQEHKRLFKFQPSKATVKRSKGNAPVKAKRGRRGPSTWKKECICLSSCSHLSMPTTEERMELAQMGLGLKELVFDVDGGPIQIHKLIMAEYPQLEAAGGYSLLRLSENSRELVVIETPGGGLTVPYLKDIVRQAKLYIRPLQCDIETVDVKPIIIQSTEPEELCRQCNCTMPLSVLRKHIQDCGAVSVDLTQDEDSSRCSRYASSDSSESATTPALVSKQPTPIVKQPANSAHSDPLTTMVPGYEEDYLSRSPSPYTPPFSPLTPVNEKEPVDVEGAMKLVARKLSPGDDDDNVLRIDVCRSCVLKDALREGKKKKFNTHKHLKVTFVGEGAVDTGGPRREFLRLLAAQLTSSPYFQSGSEGSFFACNTTGYQDNAYRILGQYAAISVVQGGPGFPFLHPTVYLYLCTGIWSPVPIPTASIPDPDLRNLISKISDANSDASLQEVLQDEDMMSRLVEAGFSKPLSRLSLSDRGNIASSLVDFHMFLKVKAVMDQFRNGLEMSGLLQYMTKYTDLLRPLFVDESCPLTANQVKDMLEPRFSDKGSTKRVHEEQAFLHFGDFLDQCEEEGMNCRLEDVVIFFSGAARPPPLGFTAQPTLEFLSQDALLPTASTCSLIMRIPICYGDYEDFKSTMILALEGNDGFGGP